MTDPTQTPQEFETAWWGDCILSSFGEEAKQLTYAPRMGLVNTPEGGHWPVYDLAGKSVLDLGGGPVSITLKTVRGGALTVVDPLPVPDWVKARYAEKGVLHKQHEAEDLCDSCEERDHNWDEVWIYNVLQHVVDPERVIRVARHQGRLLRIFEWLETPAMPGHPHTLHADDLNDWIGGSGGRVSGTVENVNENGAVGLCYYGLFLL